MLESKHFKSLGDGRRQRTDNGGQRVEGRGQIKQAQIKMSSGSRGQGEAAEEAEGSREQNIKATHENTHAHTHTHTCLGKAKVTPHRTIQMAESGGQRAKGMHWAHGSVRECNKLQQTTQEGRGHRNTPNVLDKKKVTPNRTTQGQWHEAGI